MSLCVALNDGVRYNEFTIKYLEIENHEFQFKAEMSLLEFVFSNTKKDCPSDNPLNFNEKIPLMTQSVLMGLDGGE